MHDLSQQASEAQQSRENEPAHYPRSRYVDNHTAVEVRPDTSAYPHVRAENGKVSLVGFPEYPLDAQSAKRWAAAIIEAAQIAEALRVQP